MSERIVYVNGEYCPESAAKVSIFDRGFLFADAVYEVTAVVGGKLIDFDGHLKRLRRSLDALSLPYAVDEAALLAIHRELIARNGLDEGSIYLQVTRGAADRDFIYPEAGTPATLVIFTQKRPLVDNPLARRGLRIATVDDLRWGRRDIKTVQLLYPSMAKMEAKARGADDAWLVEEGRVTEATSANAYIVTKEGAIVTRDLSHSILHGITRNALLAFAREAGLSIVERRFTVEEAREAAEAFVTSAGAFVTGVVEIDGRKIGDGTIGPVTTKLRDLYIREATARAV
ncbi:MAG: D-amino-acid transaminase [Pararhizobium sp.]